MRNQWRHILRHQPSLSPHKPTSKMTSFHRLLHSSDSNSSTTTSSIVTSNSSSSARPNTMNFLIGLYSGPKSESFKRSDELQNKVSILISELVKHHDDSESILNVLNDSGLPLFRRYADGSAMIHLLNRLSKFPLLAVEVFTWRRRHADLSCPISSEEYAKGIRVAGQAKDVDLAVEIFTEAVNNRCKTTSTYNALMGAYMMNNLPERCQWLFRELKKEQSCRPNIVTYNTLLSVFGRLMLVDHMEATVQEIYDSSLTPDIYTYNNLITGYVIAWMWDRMELTYLLMKERSLKPDTSTYKLMVRGYAHSGDLKKMEEMYELLKQHSDENDMLLIKSMIGAYCKSSCEHKIEKIDSLMKMIPQSEYRAWLIVSLIRVYAKERQLDRMEYFIDLAFQNRFEVTTGDVMRSIITAYFHSNAIDKLESFVKRAECGGWRLCRSLYHCKMFMYASERRLEEMENVLEEMENFNINSRAKKSLAILHSAYSKWGPRCKLEQVVALMWKVGYIADSDDLLIRDI